MVLDVRCGLRVGYSGKQLGGSQAFGLSGSGGWLLTCGIIGVCLFRLLLRAGGIQDRLLGVGYESVVWLFLPMLGTDTSPLSRAPVLPL